MSLVSCHHVSLLSTPFPSPCERVPSFSQPASSCISSSATILDTCRTPARRIYCCSRDYIFSRTALRLSSLDEYKKVDGRNPPAKARLINLSSRATLFAAGPSSVARVLGIRIQCGTSAVPLAHSSVLPCGKSPDCFCDDYSLGLLGSASIRTIEISATPGGRKETHENHHIMCI